MCCLELYGAHDARIATVIISPWYWFVTALSTIFPAQQTLSPKFAALPYDFLANAQEIALGIWVGAWGVWLGSWRDWRLVPSSG